MINFNILGSLELPFEIVVAVIATKTATLTLFLVSAPGRPRTNERLETSSLRAVSTNFQAFRERRDLKVKNSCWEKAGKRAS